MRKIYYCFIVIFILISSAPFWGMLFYTENAKNSENRNMAQFPQFSISHSTSFIVGLNNFIIDHHAFRDKLSDRYMSFFREYMHESPIPNSVILGKDGWYFLGNENNFAYNNVLGVSPIDLANIKRTCDNIQKMKQFCDSLGIGFYFAISPDKGSVYPQYLPLKANKQIRFKSVLISELKKNYQINTIDMGEYIYPLKDSVTLFLKNDSHWNNYGALLGTKKLIHEISKDYDLNIIDENKTIIEQVGKTGGDLTNLLKIYPKETDFVIKNDEFGEIEEINEMLKGCNITYIRNLNQKSQITALIYRDSFFNAVKNPFSTSIRRASLIRSNCFDRELTLQEIDKLDKKPDFLLFQIVERNLSIINFR
ncbi:hypothetical protein D0T53_02160 [Dysgonomonas sp. 216]|uniref:alginate O-acetyltransferase AlgX-related protein n=1 Tax=Dysgonomonas sp. 216 TaxID=2302934 RepID=UPI0013D263B8|nr:hypothetical protein [Dysgonomonas sp. 216]NDW17719.1 hypothetical protein [Dysgonomonas sp. 216]